MAPGRRRRAAGGVQPRARGDADLSLASGSHTAAAGGGHPALTTGRLPIKSLAHRQTRSRRQRGVALVLHEYGSERVLGGELIVRAAPQPDARNGGLTPSGVLEHVIVFQIRSRLASVTGVAHECAL